MALAEWQGRRAALEATDTVNITDAIFEQAQRRPDHLAIEDGDRHMTYGDLAASVSHAAANLADAGIGPGDIVTILAGDTADHVVAISALARIGAVAFAVNPWIPQREIQQRLHSIDTPIALIDARSPDVENIKCISLTDICQPASTDVDGFDAERSHPLLLAQSSGSTGRPKTFVRTHGQMEERFARSGAGFGWNEDDRYLALMSLSFDMGRILCTGLLQLGATVVFNRAETPEELVATIRDRNITYLHVTPMHLSWFLNLEVEHTPLFPELRGFYVGTAASAPADRKRAREVITPNTVATYGCNEINLLTVLSVDDEDRYPQATGRIVDGVEAQIVDDKHKVLPPDTVGLVRFRITDPPTEYLNEPQLSAQAFRDGWFYPGDLAMLNDEGILFFRGRADDAISNAGAKFYPIEVENVLNEHAAIAETAVLGWPLPKLGTVAVAAVVARHPVTIEELKNHCVDRLAGFKVPRLIVFFDELPRSPQGKVLKTELRPMIERQIKRLRAKQPEAD